MADYETKRFGRPTRVPSAVSDFSGERNVRGFLKGDRLTLHFPDVHTTTKMASLLRKFGEACAGTTGGTFGDELVLSLDKNLFEQRFGLL